MKLTIAFHLDSVEFTPDVIAGTASLGGSESACLGLARALKARGHDVYCFTTKLHHGAPKVDQAGVWWYRSSDIPAVSRFVDWDVFVALRLPFVFNLGIQAGFRILWNQDLLVGEPSKNQTMALAWAYDAVVYVSEYHRKQWEGVCHELTPIGWVTKNGYDPALVPKDVTKNPHQIIHISRPERGLRPLLAMWPELKKRHPQAELKIARYNSMYDAGGWGQVCAAFDRDVQRVAAEVGGLTYLGELGKPALYQAIAESAVMWYPGVVDFAETSCIAAIESQACGTPFVGSWKGALPETVPSGVLLPGNADTDRDYQEQSLRAVLAALDGCAKSSFAYRSIQKQGKAHVDPAYTFARIAEEWEGWLLDAFAARCITHSRRVLDRLLHEDDHVAAQALARELENQEIVDFCQYVIDGKDQIAEDYAARAVDPRVELAYSPRIEPICVALKQATTILDVACGNGAYAIALAQANPAARIVAIDYAEGNIALARHVANELGVADRITFLTAIAYDYTTHAPHPDLAPLLQQHGPFDGVFVGEFLEHIANVQGLLQALHGAMTPGARMVCTMPAGPFGELAQRDVPVKKGHVHHFRPEDLQALFGGQADLDVAFLDCGATPRGTPIGHWCVAYTPNGTPLGERPIAKRLLTTRPKFNLSVGIICGDTTDLRRCLTSIWPIADEIVIGNTGVKAEELAAICAEWPRTRVIEIGNVHELPGGFSEARNVTLQAATGDWFFWIDTDEVFVHGHTLHKYLEGGVFQGYGLKQNHLMLDTPATFDTPIRVFKRLPTIQFYGCVHEQPQMGHSNGDIVPALQLGDAQIAHVLGYLTEDVRREKCLKRNLPLLVRDQQQFPDRRLGKLLVLRDCLNLATWAREAAQGRLTDEAKSYYQRVVGLFEAHFADPADKYYPLARPFYEEALKQVAGTFEVELAFAAQQQGLKGHAKPERLWVRTPEQLQKLLDYRMQQWMNAFQVEAIDVEPSVVREQREAVSA